MRSLTLATLIALATLAACDESPPEISQANLPIPVSQLGDPAPIEIIPGRTVYVPAYTGIRYYDEGKIYPLAVTLSVRNVDPEREIVLDRVDFYDSTGELVDRYLAAPWRVAPMATAEFFVPEQDMRGGSGANFLVNWSSDEAVYPPIIESVMIGTSGTQGISFTAQGRSYE